MSYFLTFPLLLVSGMMLILGAQLLVNPAREFLREHDGPELTRLQVWTVITIFTCSGLAIVSGALLNNISGMVAFRTIILLSWGIPMVLLDVRNYWLPLRYTSGFWLTGLLFTVLPASPLTLIEALLGSSTMFVTLYIFHVGARYLRGEEGFGLGDVHLIAALCAWFPWQLASLLSGSAFFLFVLAALLTRKTAQPYAPWLFGLLATLAGCFSLQTLSGVL